MKNKSTVKQEYPHELGANAELCPLQIPTYLSRPADMDGRKDFFTNITDRQLLNLTNVSFVQIAKLLDEPKFLSGTIDEKCNAVTQLFALGLLEKQQVLFTPDTGRANDGNEDESLTASRRQSQLGDETATKLGESSTIFGQ